MFAMVLCVSTFPDFGAEKSLCCHFAATFEAPVVVAGRFNLPARASERWFAECSNDFFFTLRARFVMRDKLVLCRSLFDA
jgi:hypothetical protein